MREDTEKMLLMTALAAVLLFGGSLLAAVIILGRDIVTFWFILLVQIALAVLTFGLVAVAITALFSWCTERFDDLYRKHRALAEAVKKRTPWAVVVAGLVAQAAIVIADKSFRGSELPTVGVTLALVLLFFVANELLVHERRAIRVTGIVVWIAALVSLPLLVLVHRQFDWQSIYQFMTGARLVYKVLYPLLGLAFLIAPFLLLRGRTGQVS